MNRTRRWIDRRSTIVLGLVVAALLAVSNFAPSSSSHSLQKSQKITDGKKQQPTTRKPQEKRITKGEIKSTIVESVEQDETPLDAEDPDLPPGMAGKIDKEAYLRARGDYIDMLRGRDG